MGKLKIGFSELKITPPIGTTLLGPMKPSTGVNDDLFVRVVVLISDISFVLVTLDLIGLKTEVNGFIRKRIGEKLGIPETNIMVNSSHTHSAPCSIPWGPFWRECMESRWFNELPDKIVTCAEKAFSTQVEAVLKYSRENVSIGFNRRMPTEKGIVMQDNPDGVSIPWTDVLSFYAPGSNDLLGVLFSYAAHPVIVHGSSSLISADYPGFAIQDIKKRTGAFAVFVQGCGGNINADKLSGGFRKADETGSVLGNSVIRGMYDGKTTDPSLKCLAVKFKLPYNLPPPTGECAKMLAEYKALSQSQGNTDIGISVLSSALEELLEISKSKQPSFLDFEVQILKISDSLCIIGLSHEVFAEYRLWIEEKSPFRNNVVLGYTNGCESYIPLDKHFEEGGYEAGRFPNIASYLYYYPRLSLQPEFETMIKKNIAEIFTELRK